ncbi:7325_t:CDS:10 [Entrophospora sp. SA101]|nr:7325_t:CDS:10 [Entrophospora sp. SA101]CAJ0838253.1 5595_t:CDS:10 [Entrophospora sp. SA101]
MENNPKELFILHDGPPYANGNLHIGHALNKILKDIINRYKILQGYKVKYVKKSIYSFIPGWDCHGLPIEFKALSSFKNVKFATLKPMEIRKAAKESAMIALNVQKGEFESWGIIGDWKNPYKTLDKEYEIRQLKVFHEMVKKGYIYRQNKPVYWSPSSRTALAEAELEYNENHISNSVYVNFPISSELDLNFNPSLKNNKISIIIWTTTPWTLPANQAVAINPKIEYSIVSTRKDNDINLSPDQNLYIVATKRINDLQKIFESEFKIYQTFEGCKLIGTSYIHPINHKVYKVIESSHVTEDSGTGLVHIAPGHGMEDYEICKRLNIPAFCPVDNLGNFTSEVGEASFEGLSVLKEGSTAVINFFKKKNYLIAVEKFKHNYPYDWRTKEPVILRATPQWFADVGAVKQKAVELLSNVKMVPESARNRLEQFILSRSEWCISRQRYWGLPIPVLYEVESDTPLLTDSSIAHIIKIIESCEGSDCWWILDERELLAPEYQNNGVKYKKGMDTMDVWFDSGVSWATILDNFPNRINSPTISDLYLEGSDQHRGWFQSSLLTSAPYSTVITHGFVLDEKGHKFSKSKGNFIEPKTIIKGGKNSAKEPPYGADILRLWVASTEYVKDVNIGKNILSQIAENMRKYRGTARFMLGNLNNFSHQQLVCYDDLKPIDKFMLHELYQFGKSINASYESFGFNKTFYFDIVKDRLYADHIKSLSRTSVQTVLYHILNVYTIALAPIVPHLAEEVYENFKSCNSTEYESVFKLGWYNLIQEEWNVLKVLRSEVNQSLENARKNKLIRSSLEATIELDVTPSPLHNLIKKHELELNSIFITSNTTLNSFNPSAATDNLQPPVTKEEFDGLKKIDNVKGLFKIQVKKADLYKCPRCWIFSANNEGELCDRCDQVLKNN